MQQLEIVIKFSVSYRVAYLSARKLFALLDKRLYVHHPPTIKAMTVATECRASARSLNLESVLGGSFGVPVELPAAASAKVPPVAAGRNLNIAGCAVTGDVPRRRERVIVAVIRMAGQVAYLP
jgi:hypothetical protein